MGLQHYGIVQRLDMMAYSDLLFHFWRYLSSDCDYHVLHGDCSVWLSLLEMKKYKNKQNIDWCMELLASYSLWFVTWWSSLIANGDFTGKDCGSLMKALWHCTIFCCPGRSFFLIWILLLYHFSRELGTRQKMKDYY